MQSWKSRLLSEGGVREEGAESIMVRREKLMIGPDYRQVVVWSGGIYRRTMRVGRCKISGYPANFLRRAYTIASIPSAVFDMYSLTEILEDRVTDRCGLLLGDSKIDGRWRQ